MPIWALTWILWAAHPWVEWRFDLGCKDWKERQHCSWNEKLKQWGRSLVHPTFQHREKHPMAPSLEFVRLTHRNNSWGIYLGPVIRRITAATPKVVHVLIPGNFAYVKLHSKGELRLQIELRSQSAHLEIGEVILSYMGRPNVITKIFKSKRGKPQRRSEWWYKTDLTPTAAFEDGRRGPRGKKYR